MIANDIAYPAFLAALESLRPGWAFLDGRIVGAEGVSVTLSQRHAADNNGHVDVEFAASGARGHVVTFMDCVSGFGPTAEARAQFAAQLWAQTTGGACLEFAYSMRGDFADHYRGSDPGGFTRWHVIAGAILGFGDGDSAGALQRWWLSQPILPTLAEVLVPEIHDPHSPRGLKILFGGDRVAEVRVDGERHEAASSALADLPWPSLEPAAFVRSYVILLHPDDR